MKINLPVTDKEIELSSSSLIVSKTDLKGMLTYVNRDFLEISGFTEAELIGASHNIVRHPDMPPEAFKDLWDSLKAGRPWVGYVKNRCKNGDFYWVEAHAAPIFEGTQVVGYMSVRRKPPRDKVSAAEAAYKLFREKRQGNLVIRDGWVHSNTTAAKLRFKLRNLSVPAKLNMGVAAVTAVVMSLAGIGLGAQLVQHGFTESQALTFALETAAVAGILGVALAGVIGVMFKRLVRDPLHAELLPAFRRLSAGSYDNALDVSRVDEVGAIMQGLEIMQNRLGFDVAETKRVGDEMARIKIALDGSAMPMTISDDHGNVIYMNTAAHAMFAGMAPVLRRHVAGFDVEKLYGTKLSELLEDKTTRAEYAAELDAPRTLDVELGGRQVRVTATPVRNAQGQYLGRASQWNDRTVEIGIEREVQALVQAAAYGDFTQRLTLEGKDGFFKGLAGGLNTLLETASAGLSSVADVLQALAKGDLTQTMQGEFHGTFGQLKDDTNATVERLREVVEGIKHATDAITTASKEIAAGNMDLSSRTEEQASSLEETSSSMEELNATVKKNAENAKEAHSLVKDSNLLVTRGGTLMGKVVESMEAIQSGSKKIADIIGVIDGIAFQTNILALNAAVEAARAGEQGRGFAVVATEVRNLAQRSATAAKEIKDLITASTQQVEGGVRLVQDAGDAMNGVVNSFQQVTALVTDIAEASHEQSLGIEQVTLAVAQMDSVTQQNAALVEEAAAAASSLEDQAIELSRSVGHFNLGNTQPARDDAPSRAGVQRLVSSGRKPAARPVAADDEWAEF